METKNYYIESILRRAFSYNDSWGDTIPDSELVNNTEDAIQSLREYCTLLSKNKKCVENDFESNPISVKEIVKEILYIIWGDRELVRDIIHAEDTITKWGKSCWKDKDGKRHNVHASENGYLTIENSPVKTAEYILDELNYLEKVVISEKATADLSVYLHKWYCFEGIEEGTDFIYISDINFINDKFVFSGGHIKFTTENNYGDGVLINDVTDHSFRNLQYSMECTTSKEVKELLESKEETTLADIKQEIISSMNDWWFDNKDFIYDIEHHNEQL